MLRRSWLTPLLATAFLSLFLFLFSSPFLFASHPEEFLSSVKATASGFMVASAREEKDSTEKDEDDKKEYSGESGDHKKEKEGAGGALHAKLKSLAISPSGISLPAGLTQQLTVMGTLANKKTQDLTGSVLYTTSNPLVATVTAGGLVKGLVPGTVIITATSGKLAATTTITIAPPVLTAISLQPSATSVPAGLNQQFAVLGTYSDGSTQDLTSSSTYVSSDTAVATVDAAGLGKGLTQGSSTITTTNGSFSAAATLTVTPPVLVSLNVAPSPASIPAGLTQQLTVTGLMSDGATQDYTGKVGYSSTAPLMATVDTQGLVKGLLQGSATILAASADGKIVMVTVTVTPPVLTSIALTPATASVPAGLTQQYAVTGTYSDGSTQDLTGSSVFATSDSVLALVDASGSAKGLAQGAAMITASNGGFNATSTLTVTAPVLQGISLQPSAASMAAGLSQQLKVTGTYSDGTTQDLTVSSTFATSDAAVATVDGAGLATGLSQGVATITTTSGGFTSAANLTITPAVLTGLSLQPSAFSLPAGTSQPLTALGTYTDGSTKDVTSITLFGTSDPAVATASAGSVTGVASDTATITASLEGLSASAIATITPAVTGLPPGVVLPPDPATVAPPVDPTVATTVFSSTSFLYSGANPIQTGVASGTIEPVRAAVIRGKVMDSSLSPVSGVRVSVLNHPEFGQTYSRTDGMFDLAVNGGGYLTLIYEKAGYPTAQRQVDAPWQDYVWAEDVVLLQYDSKVTPIDLASAAPIQVAQGSTVTDADGTRKATLLFSQGTFATMVLPDGTAQPLTTLNVRATEYTVGPNGPKAMPAPLPPTSGYTYAAEFSIDEAVAAGAATVRFSKPVYVYVENFLNFPVGGIVPAGYYDKQKGAWVPSDNGKIVKILSVTNGLADLDIDGTGMPGTTASMTALGINDAERQQLAGLYPAGQSLWRVPVTHFTPWDFNWPYGPPPDALPPENPEPMTPTPKDKPNCKSGSIIECENQILGERLALAGTPFTLNYRSNKVPGFMASRVLNIPLSGASISGSLKRIRLTTSIGGQRNEQTFSPAPNLSSAMTWNGVDSYGRQIQGSQLAEINIFYEYPSILYTPLLMAQSFAKFGIAPPFGIAGRGTPVSFMQTFRMNLNYWDSRAEGLGAWSLSIHHTYDVQGKTLYKGDGSRQSASSLANVINAVKTPQLVWINRVFAAPDGSVYISQSDLPFYGVTNISKIIKLSPNGTISNVAGVFSAHLAGLLGDGGLAVNAQLMNPAGMTMDKEGNLYIADSGNNAIRKVSPAGIITTVAGNGTWGYSGDGGLAVNAQLRNPKGVAVDRDGNLYIADTVNNRIRKVDVNGYISTIGGKFPPPANSSSSYAVNVGDGGPAKDATIQYPYDVALDSKGNLYVADTIDYRIRKIGPDGLITTVAGNGIYGFSGSGGPATRAKIASVLSIMIDANDNLYIVESGAGSQIRKVGPDGIILPFIGNGTAWFSGNGGPATAATLMATGITQFPGGDFYVADWGSFSLRKVSPTMPNFSNSAIVLPSEDGAELYGFDAYGKHLRTIDTQTKAVLYSFGYDAQGLLISVTDKDGNITAIERDSAGNATAIVAPGGQRTHLSMDSNGFLSSISNPAGETHRMTYTPEGLLTSFTDPNGNTSTMTYDALGYLTKDQNVEGGGYTLSRTELASPQRGYTVTVSSALGRTDSFTTEYLTTGGTKKTSTDAYGLKNITVTDTAGTTTFTSKDGTVTTTTESPDPRFGMQAPVITQTTRTPGGLISTLVQGRTATLANANDPLSLTKLTETVSLNGKTTTTVYDAAARTTTVTSAAGRQSVSTTDILGRPLQERIIGLEPVNYAYDAKGRLSTITQGSGFNARTTTYAYDALNQLSSITDPMGHTIGFSYDLAGRVIRETLPDGRVIGYSYDANGNMTSITPPGRPNHSFTYTGVNLENTYLPPNVGAGTNNTIYTYNLDKQLTSVARPDGQTITMNYDAGGRLSGITTATGAISYTYDLTTGNQSTISTSNGETLAYTYDGSLLKSATWTGPVNGSVGFGYNSDFLVTTTSVNGANIVNFAYDNDGLLIGAGTLTISRDAQTGAVTGTTLGMVSDTFAYNAFGEVTTYDAKVGGVSVFSQQYNRDNLARLAQETRTVNGVTDVFGYSYDTAGRLTDVAKNSMALSHYMYDSNSNRLSHTGPNGTVIATYDAQDRLLTYGSSSYTYTANGELQSKTTPAGTTYYNYDVLGNLLSATLSDGTLIEYIVDGQNRRIGKKINGALVQGLLYENQLNLAAELDGVGNVVSRFVYGTKPNIPDYMVKNGVVYRIISDYLGSPRLIVDTTTGTIVQQLDYDEFGNVLSDSNPGFQPFGFAGGLYDGQTKLTRFGARDYDAETGRWSAKDPVRFKGKDSNIYDYSLGDPVNRIDRTGKVAVVIVVPEIWPGIQAAIMAMFLAKNAQCPLPDKPKPDCDQEWDNAYRICEKEIRNGINRGVTGGYTDLQNCARGLVSERCGGNKVEH